MENRASQQAHETLLKLYDLFKGELGRVPTAEEFFPIKLDLIVSSILGWQLERVDTVGFSQDGQAALGRCDFEKHRILIARDGEKDKGRQTFTLAHEIGHALLHRHAPCSTETLERPQSYRRIPENATDHRIREFQANSFARELLMPEKAVKRQLRSRFGRERLWIRLPIEGLKRTPLGSDDEKDIKDFAESVARYNKESTSTTLAEFFGVSVAAMGRRLVELQLIYR
jgi:Zn-dependent peptidase ImmA (M78 family)